MREAMTGIAVLLLILLFGSSITAVRKAEANRIQLESVQHELEELRRQEKILADIHEKNKHATESLQTDFQKYLMSAASGDPDRMREALNDAVEAANRLQSGADK